MKKLIILTVISLLATASYTQTLIEKDPYPKKITVSGAAEMEIIPDEIYVNIELREYQKKGEAKKEIEPIRSQFLAYCKEAGIADSNISISSYSGGYNNYYRLKKRDKKDDMFAGITYQVKFKSSNTMDALIEKLDDEATQNFNIISTSHSKMPEFRKQLKILAIKAAKDKGVYLTEAIGEQLGDAITVEEPDEANLYKNQMYVSNARSQAISTYNDTSSTNNSEVAFKKIKLRYEVSVVFQLK